MGPKKETGKKYQLQRNLVSREGGCVGRSGGGCWESLGASSGVEGKRWTNLSEEAMLQFPQGTARVDRTC